jgi:MFS family permease
MIQAFILASLTLTGVIAVPHLIILSIFLGLVNAFDMPTHQAFVVEMVEKRKDLGNAIALNLFLFNGARLVDTPLLGCWHTHFHPGGRNVFSAQWVQFSFRHHRPLGYENHPE